MPRSLSNSGNAENSHKSSLIEVNVADIVSVSPCADLTLPAGPALCVDTVHGSFFLVNVLKFVLCAVLPCHNYLFFTVIHVYLEENNRYYVMFFPIYLIVDC